jgi:hypothetical protein
MEKEANVMTKSVKHSDVTIEYHTSACPDTLSFQT